jgi:hypothetical protein
VTPARLLSCPSCARHVRVSEPACVFCGVTLPTSFGEAPSLPRPPRMSRGGLYTYRARALAASTAALVTASCGGALTTEPSEAGSQDGSAYGNYGPDAGYGGSFPFDAFSGYDANVFPDASSRDSSFGDVSLAGPYGLAPPNDASSLRASPDATAPDSAAQDAADHDVNYALPYGVPPQP